MNVSKVSFTWPCGKKALDKCDLNLSSPGLWMIVGENGSGKSTLFRILSGMIDPQGGSITSYYKTSLVFQNPDHHILMPTCASDLLLNISSSLTTEQKYDRVLWALAQVGLSGLEGRPIHTLSGGQKQRLALAGALASEANLLLLDEPTALLDPISQNSVIKLVQGLCNRQEDPKTALWITHRLEELEYCKGAALMENGKLGKWQEGKLILEKLLPSCY
tara:strand:- start:76 stop:732 length:657 start_codon:yes stop_codon:yes gene_type:complete